MAEYYCDPNSYPTYAATPTWATAQEGDGLNGSGAVFSVTRSGNAVQSITATTAGTGYSTNTKLFIEGGGGTGATATVSSVNDAGGITGITVGAGGSGYTSDPTVRTVPGLAISAVARVAFSGTLGAITSIQVMGATVSATGVASTAAATAATNFAANINATTNTVSSSVSPSTPQLRNLVWARVVSSTQVEIMTRAGSQQLNYADNTNVAITFNVMTGVTITNFGEGGEQKGRSGCWGYMGCNTTLWPSAVAKGTYGAHRIGSGSGPLAGPQIGAGDVVHVRANNAEVLSNSTSGTFTVQFNAPAHWLVDDGTVWVGDTGTFMYRANNTTATAMYVECGTIGSVLEARTKGKWVFRMEGTAAAGQSRFVQPTASASVLCRKLRYEDYGVIAMIISPSMGNQSFATFEDCEYVSTRSSFSSPWAASANGPNGYIIRGCTFHWTNFSTGPAGPLVATTASAGHTTIVENCTATFGATPQNRPTPFSGSPNLDGKLVARNLEGFSLPTTGVGLTGAYTTPGRSELGYVLLQNVGSNRAFRLETNVGVLDWMPDQGYPVIDSYLPDGTAWSYRWIWSADTDAYKHATDAEALRLTKTNIASDGVRTIAMELFVDDAYDHLFTLGHVALHIAYVDASDGKMKFQNTQTAGSWTSASAISSSSKSWTGNSYAGTHVARKLEITTATSVKQNTEIEASLMFYKAAPALQELFINPELTIT